jgi:hypothetical protein
MSADSLGLAADRELKFYKIFGLVVASELSLPEATKLDLPEPDAVDVQLQLGGVPDALSGARAGAPWVQFSSQKCLLSFGGIARFLVDNGRTILVDKHPDATYEDLRGFLFGSAFGALAHQRRLIPLHVSAVATPHGCIAFTGNSGAGKSTIVAQLNKELNWPLICDDVAVVGRAAGRLSLFSGINTTKLWRDSLTALGRDTEGLRRDLTRYEKFHAIEPRRFEKVVRPPLVAIVVLNWGAEVSCRRLVGREAAQAAIGSIYRPEFGALFGDRSVLVSETLRLASEVRFGILERPKDFSGVQEIAQAVSTLAQ